MSYLRLLWLGLAFFIGCTANFWQAALIERAGATATPASTPDLSPTASIFRADTCTAPCWFELTVGETTTDEVIEVFQEHENLFIFNPQQEGNLLIPDYESLMTDDVEEVTFLWTEWDSGRQPIANNIFFEEDVITWMRIWMNRMVTLEEVLEAYGEPESVSASGGIATLSLTLIYPDYWTVVHLTLSDDTQPMNTLLQNFTVAYVYYYTPETFETLAARYNFYQYTVEPSRWVEWISDISEEPAGEVIGEFLFEADAATRAAPSPTPP